jgi:hypothetical protein
VDASVATRWFSGARRPDTKMRAALEREYGIGWMLWDDEVEEQEDGGAPTAAE